MGVTNGSSVLYTMENVRLPHLFMIAVDRAKRHSRQDPVIVVDFSWLCCKCGTETDTPPTAFRKVAAHLLLLLETGFVVHVVLDPHHRHHSKKATVARNVAAHRATIGAIKAKSEILSLTRRHRSIASFFQPQSIEVAAPKHGGECIMHGALDSLLFQRHAP
jgi:hypothetical protein